MSLKNYLKDAVEWTARRIIARAVTRAAEIVDELDESYDAVPKSLPAPRLPEITYD